MRKMLLGAIILLIFSLSLVLIQTSCSKTDAQTSPGLTQLNKVIYLTADRKWWISNYDGTNTTQINFNLPSGVAIETGGWPVFNPVRLSPDGQRIFFTTFRQATAQYAIASTDISGNGYTQIVAGSTSGNQPQLAGVY